MVKCLGADHTGLGSLMFHSAENAFEVLHGLDPEVAKPFGVFEIPITRVMELASNDEEGKSC